MSQLHTTSGRWKLGLALSLVTACLWGSLPIALKSVLSVMQAQTIVWYRFVGATVLLGGILLSSGKLKGLLPKKRSTALLLVIAAVGFAGNNLIFTMGLGYVTPTAAQVVIQLAPVILLFGGVVIFRERFGGMQLVGLAILLFGMGVFFHERLGELFGNFTNYAFGVFLVVIAAVVWAGYALAQKQLLTSYSSPALMWMIYLSGVVLLLPLAHPAQAAMLDGVQVAILVYCALMTILGYGAFAEALAHWEATRVSAVVAVTPLITWLLNRIAAALLPGYAKPEELSAWSVVGAGLVTLGCGLAALARRR